MSKARTLADFISDGSEFADGTISVAEVSGAAPLASPSFTGDLTTGGNIILDEASAAAHGEATKTLTASGNGYYQDLRISANDYDFRYGPSAWNSAYSALQISSTGSVVFNEGGLDADTRFEGTSDSNVLAVNAGNNRVGVGTNGGLHKLSVLHTGTALGGVAHFSIGSAASAYATTVFRVDNVDNNFAIDQNYAGQDRNRLFIKRTNGYVGIGGVTSPNAMLHVESNGSGNYAAIVNHTQATNPNGLWINYSGSGYIDTYALRIQNTDGVIWDQRGTGSLFHYAQANATVAFNNGATTADFKIKSDNISNMFFVDGATDSIGVGTTTPNATFGIQAIDDAEPVLRLTSSLTAGENVHMRFQARTNSNNNVYADIQFDPDISSGALQFYTDYGYSTADKALQLDAANGAIFNDGGSSTRDFRVESASNTHMLFVDANENHISINHDNPNAELDVKGEQVLRGKSNGGGITQMADSGVYTASTSATNIFQIYGLSNQSAEITIIYTDGSYRNGSFLQKIYVSCHGSGTAPAGPNVIVENKSRAHNGTFPSHFTWTASTSGSYVIFAATANTTIAGGGTIHVHVNSISSTGGKSLEMLI